MMVPDPLRSATDVEGAEDTSLAMPSDKSLSSGQQRVLSQVSMKRSKSKYNKNTSPTITAPQTTKTFNDFGTFKFKGTSTYNRSNSTMSAGFRGKSRSLTTKSTRGRYVNSDAEQVSTSLFPKSPNGLKTSRSDPAFLLDSKLAPAPSMKANGQAAKSQQNIQTQSRESYSVINGLTSSASQRVVSPVVSHSQTDGKLDSFSASKIEQASMVNSADLTLEEAVEYLLNEDERLQLIGANYIQHKCYNAESAKLQVFKLKGIASLVNLLSSENPRVNSAASGALRNLVYKNTENKKAVQKYGGVAKVLNLMKRTESTETNKQLAGLLWNLSSDEELKEELITTALIALSKNVLVPFTNYSESEQTYVDPEVFHSATGCIRNMSSTDKEDYRQRMRGCKALIESLIKYIKSCVAEEKPDDRSVENCMCTLQNLTYQVWKESGEVEESFPAEAQSEGRRSPTVGCFSPRSRKAQKEFFSGSVEESKEDSTPTRVALLWAPKTLEVYVDLLSSAENHTTKEACLGAMQNLTGSGHKGAAVVSENVFPKLYEKFVMPSILKSHNQAIQSLILSLLDNMSRKPNMLSKIAKQLLPELSKLLQNDVWMERYPVKAKATVCLMLHRLLLVDHETSKKTITRELVLALSKMIEGCPENDAYTEASKLLYNMWKDKFLHSITKNLKMSRAIFVNEKTIAVHIKGTEENE